MRCHRRQISAQFAERQIQFGDFIDRDFWCLFGDSRNDESSMAHLFRKSVYDRSVDFPRLRIVFALALSYHSEMQNAAACNCGWCARLKNVDFPTSRMSRHTIKALLPIRRKKRKRKNSFCGPNDTPMYYPFFSPVLSSPSERINCTWRDEGTVRTR